MLQKLFFPKHYHPNVINQAISLNSALFEQAPQQDPIISALYNRRPDDNASSTAHQGHQDVSPGRGCNPAISNASMLLLLLFFAFWNRNRTKTPVLYAKTLACEQLDDVGQLQSMGISFVMSKSNAFAMQSVLCVSESIERESV